MPVSELSRQLKIKTGVYKRLSKERDLYVNEEAKARTNLEKMKADGRPADIDEGDWDWKLRNADKLLQEASKMIPDTDGRLSSAHAELKDLILEADKTADVNGSPEHIAAKEVLETQTVS